MPLRRTGIGKKPPAYSALGLKHQRNPRRREEGDSRSSHAPPPNPTRRRLIHLPNGEPAERRRRWRTEAPAIHLRPKACPCSCPSRRRDGEAEARLHQDRSPPAGIQRPQPHRQGRQLQRRPDECPPEPLFLFFLHQGCPSFPPPPRVSRIAECLIGDETGAIIFTARNEQVDLMKPGATVILRNAKIDMFKGTMRLAVDKWGLVQVADPADFEVKEDNNLSLVEYELVNVTEE